MTEVGPVLLELATEVPSSLPIDVGKGGSMLIPRFIIVAWVFSFSPSYALTLFEENFSKGAPGKVEHVRMFTAEPGSATIIFTNGDGANFDTVGNGTIEVNGEVIYSSFDFKVAGFIFKTIAVDASNTLTIELGGPQGGQIMLEIVQGEDEPVLEFPPDTVFVSSTTGDDSVSPDCGAQQTPCQTIDKGLMVAMQNGGPQVSVAAGVYTENVTLEDGIDVLGGYDPAFTKRDIAAFRPIVRGDGTVPATISAVDITSSTTFGGFLVLGTPITDPSGNSIGIGILGSTSALEIVNNIVFAGTAGQGDRGVQGFPGVPGVPGGNGSTDGTFGFGGASVAGSGGDGGLGEPPLAYNTPQNSGQSGSGGVPGGAGGFNGERKSVANGGVGCDRLSLPSSGTLDASNGGDGQDGDSGNGGAGGSGGALIGDVWVSDSGDPGFNGQAGSGGGGGGAGGGSTSDGCTEGPASGTGGGGGGSAGSAGGGGGGGGGGGSSFGIYVVANGLSDVPLIGSNEIYLGQGGSGGDGGQGAFGGAGAVGGVGGAGVVIMSGRGGDGGRGGSGGHGGGGGGGAGGDSVGLFADFANPDYQSDNVFHTSIGVAGRGGFGGSSPVHLGADGQDGEVADIIFLP